MSLGGSACAPAEFLAHQPTSGIVPGQSANPNGRIPLNSGRLAIVRGLPSRAGSLPNAQGEIAAFMNRKQVTWSLNLRGDGVGYGNHHFSWCVDASKLFLVTCS